MKPDGPIDIDHLRTWIGRTETIEDVVSADTSRKYRATFDQPTGDLAPGAIAPLVIHFCLAQRLAPTAELAEDGHPERGGFLPPIAMPRRMWAGGEIQFLSDLRIGEAIRRTSTVLDVVLKEGRTGALCFVKVEHIISANGEARVREIQDIVYRPADAGAPPPASATPASVPLGDHRRDIEPAPALLFRYSAITFNGHRIHYDRRYAKEQENYQGLVVHGPLQATLLADYAAELKGRRPCFFSFQSRSALFDDDLVVLHATVDGDEMKLWTARPGGPAAMMAKARWA